MTATERLARFVYELDLAAIAVPVREYAKLWILDTFIGEVIALLARSPH